MPRRSRNAEVAALETSIENHVASRIRLRRGLLGMSQSDLAKTLGITFQQVQKYERGSNRVSVGKLYRLAEILDVPLTFFFDGLDLPQHSGSRDVMDSADAESSILSRRELDVLRAWKTAPSPVADAVASLLRSVTTGDLPEIPEDLPPQRAMSPMVERKPMAVDIPAPKRRGRPPKAKTEAADLTARRRRNAVWDPSDIERAARGKSN